MGDGGTSSQQPEQPGRKTAGGSRDLPTTPNGQAGAAKPAKEQPEAFWSTDEKADQGTDFQDLNGHPDNLEVGFHKEPA